MASPTSSRKVVHAALIGNLLVAATKLFAAAWTSSSAMMSEAVHSFVDCGNELLLLHGLRRAAQGPDAQHPLGHGRELYFWSFIVALLIFALGAVISIYEGIDHIRHPAPIRAPGVDYLVLALALAFESVSWAISLRQFRAAKGPLGYFEAFRKSKDPASFMVLFEDSAAIVGILIATIGTFLTVRLHQPRFDGIASILIGLVLALVSFLLTAESKSLLIGERADQSLSDAILQIARSESAVTRANGVITMQLAPDQIVAALSLDFEDALSARQVEDAAAEIERKVTAAHPHVVALFVKPQAHRNHEGPASAAPKSLGGE
ncbi:MAG TPA: cation diffusion facilitator family transporter [Steroidobacteraceae bacterium]|nr:cation diffusion facilitator family transporter [Steroidobacteraceae bacterium]